MIINVKYTQLDVIHTSTLHAFTQYVILSSIPVSEHFWNQNKHTHKNIFPPENRRCSTSHNEDDLLLWRWTAEMVVLFVVLPFTKQRFDGRQFTRVCLLGQHKSSLIRHIHVLEGLSAVHWRPPSCVTVFNVHTWYTFHPHLDVCLVTAVLIDRSNIWKK